MDFSARVFDPHSGTTSETQVSAPDPMAARLSLETRGWILLDLKTQGLSAPVLQRPFNLQVFCQQTKTLLHAGMSLVEALDTLSAKNTDVASTRVLRSLQARLQEGKTFSAALETTENVFPPILIAAVRASERTGRVADALTEYLRYDDVLRGLKRKIVHAALYPALVVGFGCAVVLFLMTYVVPRFALVYTDVTRELSGGTRWLLWIGRAVDMHGWLLLGMAGLVGLGLALLARQGVLKRWLLRTLALLPVAQRAIRTFQLARIYQTLCMLMRGGYTVVDAIGLARSLAFDPALAASVERACRAISEGKALSQAFANEGLTDTVSERLLQVGERSGRFDTVLETIAETYSQTLEHAIERFSRVIEPVLLMAVALMVGAIVVLMYMPVFELAGGLGG